MILKHFIVKSVSVIQIPPGWSWEEIEFMYGACCSAQTAHKLV